MNDGRRWLALDADMFGKPFIHDLHDRFGPAGVCVWVAFLSACKRSRTPGRIRIMNSAQGINELGLAGWELVDGKGEPWDLEDFFTFTGRKKQTRRRPIGRRDARRTATGQCFDVDATHWQRWQDDGRRAYEAEQKRRSRGKKRPGDNGHAPDTPRTNVRPDSDSDSDTPQPPNGGQRTPCRTSKSQPPKPASRPRIRTSQPHAAATTKEKNHMTTCTHPGCDQRAHNLGLCPTHYHADYRARRQANGGHPLTQDTTTPILVGDDYVIACPPDLLDLASQAADLDARRIVRAIWPHLLEASLAGLEPFTLEQTGPDAA